MMARERVTISASALGLAACLSLLALPPATARASAALEAPARVAEARREVVELLDTLREAVQRRHVKPAAARRPASMRRPASPVVTRPAGRFRDAGPPAISPTLARLVNLPPPAVG